jgi:ABC-type Fe3+ transport system substrate-binding protein
VSGEVAISAVNQSIRIETSKAAGAPVEMVVPEPIILTTNVTLVPKGARHANAAAVVNAWFLTDEGQRFMDRGYPNASAFRPGSAAARFVEGKAYVRPTEYQIKNTARVQKQFEEIIVKR